MHNQVFTFRNRSYSRYPRGGNKSLRPWSSIDELILDHVNTLDDEDTRSLAICEDAFGVLSTELHELNPTTVLTYHSQSKAIHHNLEINGIKSSKYSFVNVNQMMDKKASTVLIKIPKSIDLFELYLQRAIAMGANKIISGFMTKYFTPSLLTVANKYFGSVMQSRATKKARLLLLAEPKVVTEHNDTNQIRFDDKTYQQYYGVFSREKIDIGTQFLLANLPDLSGKVLDLACGNGIIGDYVSRHHKDVEAVSFLDDSALAIASAKLNHSSDEATFIWSDCLDHNTTDQFDTILLNPPFHFGHEIDINVSLSLFKEAYHALKPTGKLIIVANRHLNYSTHLIQTYSYVSILANNKKFEIIQANKSA